MLATLIIVLRETIEAGLIIGIVLAATQGVAGRGRQVALGVAAGLGGACVLAAFAGEVADAFDGQGQEIMTAAILLIAVGMLAWHTVWMTRHGRAMAAELRGVGDAVRAGGRPVTALAVVVGVAVLREGAEVVLFLAGIAAGGQSGWVLMLAGGLAGAALGGAVSWLTHAGLLRLPARHLFGAMFWLIALLAAGMAGQAAASLQSAGLDLLDQTLWDSSSLLPDSSLTGRVLHTLIGYSDHPSALQAVAFALTLGGIVMLGRRPAGR